MGLWGALPQNPNGNATRFVTMDEVFFGECPNTEGQPPDAALQLDSGWKRPRGPSGSEATKYIQRVGQVGEESCWRAP